MSLDDCLKVDILFRYLRVDQHTLSYRIRTAIRLKVLEVREQLIKMTSEASPQTDKWYRIPST